MLADGQIRIQAGNIKRVSVIQIIFRFKFKILKKETLEPVERQICLICGMRINIIHLESRNDRIELLLDQLAQQGISDYLIWKGIVDPNITARGISKAHKQIVKFAKANRLTEVLIAEDDLMFTAVGAFDFFLKNKPEDFDLYLASIYWGEITVNNTVNDFAGLTFYVVKERYYDTFLAIPEHDNLDRLMKDSGKFIVCNPFTVIQRSGFSDNVRMHCDYDRFLMGRRLFKNS